MLTIVPVGIIIVALGTILMIAVRHAPKAAALDISDLPEERDAQLKSTILENRLLRKIDGFAKGVSNIFAPITKVFGQWYSRGIKRMRSMERTYRFQTGLPDSSKKASLKVRDRLEAAAEALSSNKLSSAESNFLSVLKMDPHSLEAYTGLGDTYRAMGEFDQARETFSYVIKHWPQEDIGFARLAGIEEASGNLEKAKDHFLHALSINNEVAMHHLGLADLYVSLSEKEKALSSLQKAQALEPNNPKILDQLFLVSVLLKNRELAEEAFNKIKKINPDHGRLGEFEKKLKALKK